MIIYLTKQTAERYKIKMPDELSSPLKELVHTVIEREHGSKLFEWGAKLFYFDRKKCIQLVHFESKLTLFLFDIKVKDIEKLGEWLTHYLFDLYSDNKPMTKRIEKYIEESSFMCFSALKDKSILATLNYTQRTFAEDGYYFYDFIEEGILKTIEINQRVNFKWLFSKKEGKQTDYFYSGEKFEKVLIDRYGSI